MVIVDNNFLSALAKIERLAYLSAVFEEVSALDSVFEELSKATVDNTSFVDKIEAVKTYNDAWLEIISPTEQELQVAANIRDHALSLTDAQCIATALHRDKRLLTDDGHVGTVAQQKYVEVWDLVLLLQATIRAGVITDAHELTSVIDALAQQDNYQFSVSDRNALFDELET